MILISHSRVTLTLQAVGACALSFIVACSRSDEEATKSGAAPSASMTAADSNRSGSLTVTFTGDQYRMAAISTDTVQKRNLSNVIKLNGAIDAAPASIAMVSAPLGGYVKSAGFLPGQVVKEGRVLATLENPEFTEVQQQYLESKARMEFVELEYQRQQRLRAEDVNATKTLQEITSERKILTARIAGLEQRMTLAGIPKASVDAGTISRIANVVAPISGFIRTSNISIGKYVSPTDALFEIVNTSELHLTLNAYERDIGVIKTGQTVRFSVANEDSFSRTAKVFLIGQVSGADRLVPVQSRIVGGSRDLLPGMYARAWIESGSVEGYAVKSDAVVQFEGKDYVVLESGTADGAYTFTFQQVQVGIQQEGYTGITLPAGFNLMSKVVTKNAFAVLAALKNAQEG